MLDRVDPGPYRRPRGEIAVGVRRGLALQSMRLVDDGGQLFVRQLRRRDVVAEREDAARGAHLDDVGAVLDVRGERPRGPGPRRGGCPSPCRARGRTCSAESPCRRSGPRSRRGHSARRASAVPAVRPLGDRVAQAHVQIVRRADVPDGRESRLEDVDAHRPRRRGPAREWGDAGRRRNPERNCRPIPPSDAYASR